MKTPDQINRKINSLNNFLDAAFREAGCCEKEPYSRGVPYLQNLFANPAELVIAGTGEKITSRRGHLDAQDAQAIVNNRLFSAVNVYAIGHHELLQTAGYADRTDDLLSMVFMIRCVFAHGLFNPRWEVRDPVYQRLMQTPEKDVTLDCRKLDKVPYDLSHHQGYSGLIRLSRAVRARLLPQQEGAAGGEATRLEDLRQEV